MQTGSYNPTTYGYNPYSQGQAVVEQAVQPQADQQDSPFTAIMIPGQLSEQSIQPQLSYQPQPYQPYGQHYSYNTAQVTEVGQSVIEDQAVGPTEMPPVVVQPQKETTCCELTAVCCETFLKCVTCCFSNKGNPTTGAYAYEYGREHNNEAAKIAGAQQMGCLPCYCCCEDRVDQYARCRINEFENCIKCCGEGCSLFGKCVCEVYKCVKDIPWKECGELACGIIKCCGDIFDAIGKKR